MTQLTPRAVAKRKQAAVLSKTRDWVWVFFLFFCFSLPETLHASEGLESVLTLVRAAVCSSPQLMWTTF